jgi:shikimate dehydrogenase
MGSTPRAFVMGHPIAHSRSPMMHGYWLEKLGIDGQYERLDVAPENIPAFFASFRDEGWVGGNVTVPHKSAVVPFIDRVDETARLMGAVNTLYWDGDALVGTNTDGIGFAHNLDDRAPRWEVGAETAVILGAGGASRAAIHALQERGLEVVLCNRTIAKAEALAAHFGKGVSVVRLEEVSTALQRADVLVQATSLGMIGQPPISIDLSKLRDSAVVCDVVYVPLETQLLRDARARGHRTVDGLGMLMHQAVAGFARWFGQTPTVTDELRQILADDIRAKTPAA